MADYSAALPDATAQYTTASQVWQALDGIKQPMMDRIERYAALTIPKICLPEGFNAESTDQTHDYQSIGAQGTNHLTNKIMLALFAPSRPFFRVSLGAVSEQKLNEAGIPADQVAPILAKMERDAVAELDQRGQRPRLYACIRHLIIAGNVLLHLGKKEMRVLAIRNWCVKRDNQGRVHTLIIKECIKYDELDEDVRAQLVGRYNPDTKVDHYKLIRRQPNDDYTMSQWVNETRLPKKFDGKWAEADLPYRVLTWDLDDASDYATGLIEEYAGDLEAVSVLSESVVDGAVLGTEYRWLVNPTGMTSADDLNKSKNGDALPGVPADIAPTQGGNPMAIQTADAVLARYEKRIGMGFLLQTAVTRDAERVTAEEIRQTAMELETAFGGVYSSLAQLIQQPIAVWLLAAVGGSDIRGTDLKVSVITGLDALSRNGDLENLRAALSDLGNTMNLPPQLLGRIKFEPLAKFVGDGRGIDLSPFLMNDAEYNATVQQAQEARVNEASATAAGEAQGQANAQPQG